MKEITQKTIKNNITCSGVSLHKGLNVTINLFPAKENTGIIFSRIDVPKEQRNVLANYKNVTATNLGTVIENSFGVKVSTIEHLMAALWSCEIDNLIIEIDAEEVPIMDGSAAPFIFLIECAGIKNQKEDKKIIKIKKDILFSQDDKFIKIQPANHFSFDLEVDFNHKMLGKQKFTFDINKDSFKYNIARARTFAFEKDIAKMQSVGLAKGGSMANAIVIGENRILNEGGLRMGGEFVKHKALDFIGDLALVGHYIMGHFQGFKTGHGVNNAMLHQIFIDDENWEFI
ncbi:UDP-3-O-acyl-N-acetylglucosamine deacetylase [Flavobacteriaceae bacterium]|nr:UDP-3-O-acyl-N-acetylglucosamine deacetylase [Flavobacteriaceae bacterium]